MPNLQPADLPIVDGGAAMQGWPGDCSAGNCVDVVEGGDTFARIVSTRRPESTGVPFDADEVVKFLDEVKAGMWDGLHARARAAASAVTPA